MIIITTSPITGMERKKSHFQADITLPIPTKGCGYTQLCAAACRSLHEGGTVWGRTRWNHTDVVQNCGCAAFVYVVRFELLRYRSCTSVVRCKY